jgi:hypothetical protein
VIGLPEISHDDLWVFAFEKGKARFRDFEEFCHNHPSDNRPSKIARQTMSNYIKDLVREKKLKRDLDEGERHPHYFVPEELHNTLKEHRQTKLIIQIINENTSKFLRTLKDAIFKIISPLLSHTIGFSNISSPEELETELLAMGFTEEQIIRGWMEGTIADPLFKTESEAGTHLTENYR